MLHNKRSHHNEIPTHQSQEALATTREEPAREKQQRRPSRVNIHIQINKIILKKESTMSYISMIYYETCTENHVMRKSGKVTLLLEPTF